MSLRIFYNGPNFVPKGQITFHQPHLIITLSLCVYGTEASTKGLMYSSHELG